MKKYALSLTSAFSTTSLLKARIMMLYRKPSAKFALAKFGFALPALVLCMLITAFTQRERILPASLLAETNAVAQRLTQEVQKAFLPAVATPTVADRQARQEVMQSTEIVAENETLPTQDMVEKPTMLSIIQPKNVAWQASEVVIKTDLSAVVMPVDSTKKAKKSKKVIDKWHPYSFDNYFQEIRERIIKKGELLEINVVLQKHTKYLMRFYKEKDKSCIDISPKIKVSQNDKILSIQKTDLGYEFTTESQVRTHKIICEDTPKEFKVAMVLYCPYEHNNFPEVELLDSQDQKTAWKEDVNLNQNFKLFFVQTGLYTDLTIDEVVITVIRDKKGVVFEKVVNNSEFNLKDLEVQKGDIISINVSEFSGNFKDKRVSNPMYKGSLADPTFRFSIYPKIK